MNVHFPNESDAYRAARKQLLRDEIALRAQVEQVAASRRALPAGGQLKEDYMFEQLDEGGRIRERRLSELFARHDSLFLYSFMFAPDAEQPCPMCTSVLDALNGNAPHITERLAMAVVARAPIERVAGFARDRGWHNLDLLSAHGNSYQGDYFGENEAGEQMPMGNVFVRRDGAIHHFWGTEMLFAELPGQPRHMDMLWPLWNMLDVTPGGRGEDWYPSLHT